MDQAILAQNQMQIGFAKCEGIDLLGAHIVSEAREVPVTGSALSQFRRFAYPLKLCIRNHHPCRPCLRLRDCAKNLPRPPDLGLNIALPLINQRLENHRHVLRN